MVRSDVIEAMVLSCESISSLGKYNKNEFCSLGKNYFAIIFLIIVTSPGDLKGF